MRSTRTPPTWNAARGASRSGSPASRSAAAPSRSVCSPGRGSGARWPTPCPRPCGSPPSASKTSSSRTRRRTLGALRSLGEGGADVAVMVDSVEGLDLIDRALENAPARPPWPSAWTSTPAGAPPVDGCASARAARPCARPRRPPRSPARCWRASGSALVGDHGLRGPDRRRRRRSAGQPAARPGDPRDAGALCAGARAAARGDRRGCRGDARSRAGAAAAVRQRRRHRQHRGHRGRARRHRGRGRLGALRAHAVRRLQLLQPAAGGDVRAARRASPGPWRGDRAGGRLPGLGARRRGPAAAPLPARGPAARSPGGCGRGADAAAGRCRRQARDRLTASTSATPRPASCASASPAFTCSRGSASSRRHPPTAARDNASCEGRRRDHGGPARGRGDARAARTQAVLGRRARSRRVARRPPRRGRGRVGLHRG